MSQLSGNYPMCHGKVCVVKSITLSGAVTSPWHRVGVAAWPRVSPPPSPATLVDTMPRTRDKWSRFALLQVPDDAHAFPTAPRPTSCQVSQYVARQSLRVGDG